MTFLNCCCGLMPAKSQMSVSWQSLATFSSLQATLAGKQSKNISAGFVYVCWYVSPKRLRPADFDKTSWFCALAVVLVSGPSDWSGQRRITCTCTGKTAQKAGSRCSRQAAAVSSLVAIGRTWQRRSMTLMNIYEGLKIYLLFTQTNKVGVCVSDGAITPAGWCCDVATLTGEVNETEDRWASITVELDSWTKTWSWVHSNIHTCTRKNFLTDAGAYMDDWARLTSLSPVTVAEGEEKQMTCRPLCCGPKLLYQTLPGSQLKNKSEAKLQWGVFLSLCSMCQLHCNLIFPLFAFYRQHLQGFKWIFWKQWSLWRLGGGRNLQGCRKLLNGAKTSEGLDFFLWQQ